MSVAVAAASPVRRLFDHALADRPSAARYRIRMRGSIASGLWLPIRATEELTASTLCWRGSVGLPGLPLLTVTDAYDHGRGRSDVRLGGVLSLDARSDEDVTRSACARLALELVTLCPALATPEHGVTWSAILDDTVLARFDRLPGAPAVFATVDEDGALRRVWGRRWGPTADGEGHAERWCTCVCGPSVQTGGQRVPSTIEVAWADALQDEAQPFLRATVLAVEPVARDQRAAATR